jgi:uroporphyrinogen III methyltransferase/synthase
VAEVVAEEFPEPVNGLRIMIPRAREARELLPELWRSQGAEVDVVPVYETVPDRSGAEMLRERLERGEIDVVTFTASSTVRNFLEVMPGVSLNGVTIACIGPITAETAREAGLNPAIVARDYTISGLVSALEHYYVAT